LGNQRKQPRIAAMTLMLINFNNNAQTLLTFISLQPLLAATFDFPTFLSNKAAPLLHSLAVFE